MADEPEIVIATELSDNRGRFVATRGGQQVGEMTFSQAGERMILVDHTEVVGAARGDGVGELLFAEMVSWARREQRDVVPVCPFATAMFKRHEETRDVLQGGGRSG